MGAAQARSLAPGAVRLAGCFSDARVRLAHALAQLAADEVAALGAALDKEVWNDGGKGREEREA